MPQQDTKDVFEKEKKVLQKAEDILTNEELSPQEIREGFASLMLGFKTLLEDAQVITNISDRLQNRLDKANNRLFSANEELQVTNEKLNDANENIKASAEELRRKHELLQITVDELTKTRISKKATTIALMAAIILFVISEVFLEPIVDRYFKDEFAINLIIKLSIALLLKPIDYMIEWYLQKDARRKAQSQPKTEVSL